MMRGVSLILLISFFYLVLRRLMGVFCCEKYCENVRNKAKIEHILDSGDSLLLKVCFGSLMMCKTITLCSYGRIAVHYSQCSGVKQVCTNCKQVDRKQKSFIYH